MNIVGSSLTNGDTVHSRGIECEFIEQKLKAILEKSNDADSIVSCVLHSIRCQQQFQKILRKNGYQTVMIGKIHLNGMMQGFDYWEVLPGQGKYYNPDFVTQEGKTQVLVEFWTHWTRKV